MHFGRCGNRRADADRGIRLGATLAAIVDVPGGVDALVDAVIESDASAKPACVAQVVQRYYA